MRLSVVKNACDNCSISFDPDLNICKTCDKARFTYCYLKKKRLGVVKITEGD
jgi:RNA polymerase subunit RPABC4/transcription elongation factor Spt4